MIKIWDRKNQPLDLRLMARLVHVELILVMVAIWGMDNVRAPGGIQKWDHKGGTL